MDDAFPIVRRPAWGPGMPVLVSVPHYGTRPLPDITADHYREPSFASFAYGFADVWGRQRVRFQVPNVVHRGDDMSFKVRGFEAGEKVKVRLAAKAASSPVP